MFPFQPRKENNVIVLATLVHLFQYVVSLVIVNVVVWCGAQLYLGQNFEAPFWWNSTRLLQIYIQKQVKAKGHNNFSTEKGYRAHNEVIG